MSAWEAKVDSLINNLVQDGRVALYDIGFFEGTLGNKTVNQKIADSFAGHAADTAIRAVASKLVMFVCRNVEPDGDTISRFISLTKGNADLIEAKRLARRPDLPSSFLEIGEVEDTINALQCELDKLNSLAAVKWIRVHRDERLGHSLRGKSGFRRKLKDPEFTEESVRYDDLLEAANETARLMFEAYRIWTFTLENPRSRIRIVRDQTKSFWNCLPILIEVER